MMSDDEISPPRFAYTYLMRAEGDTRRARAVP